MSDDDEFETPQFRTSSNSEETQRSVHLRPHTPTFALPPRTSSFHSLDTNHVTSTNDFIESIDETENIQKPKITKENIQMEKVKHQLNDLYKNPTPFIETIVENAALGKNQIIIDVLNQTLFLTLSSILQSHKGRKAIIVIPSLKIAQWVRSFLIDSTAMCPEGRAQQQKVLSQIIGGSTQVMLCVANRLSTLQLTLFDYVLVVKTELIEDCLLYLSDFHGTIILHQTPGFSIPNRFNCLISKNEALSLKCKPKAVFLDNYLDSLYESIDNEEKTCIIVPFKNIIDKIFKRIHDKSVKFGNNYSNDDARACVGTTAVFYTTANFDHYIFVEFPPNINYLIMATYIGEKVSVFVHTPTAFKLQSLSHSRGIDMPDVQQIVQSIFWNDSNYRKNSEICSVSVSGLDVTNESFNDIIAELVFKKYVRYIPFHSQTLNVKINSIVHQESSLLTAISKNRSNAHGFYNIQIVNLCKQLKIDPLQLENELIKLEKNKTIQYKLLEKTNYFTIFKEFDDDDDDASFMNIVREISSKLLNEEVQRDHNYDIMFHILKHPDDYQLIIDNFLKDSYQSDPNNDFYKTIDGLPHSKVDISEIKKLLTNSRYSELTPRAISRIIHGISSPLFTYDEWSRSPYWDKQTETSFIEVMQICQKAACNPNKLNEEAL